MAGALGVARVLNDLFHGTFSLLTTLPTSILPVNPTDMALLGEWPPVPQRRCVVLVQICGIASPVVRLKTLRCDGLRHRKREDQHGYGGQVSHGLIIGRRVLLPQSDDMVDIEVRVVEPII
jgi:hypothetical protein